MIEIEGKLLSLDLFEKEFVCNLSACKGACCIEGDTGAPLTFEEVDILEESFEKIKPFMTEKGIAVVEQNGVFYMDHENHPVTSLVDGKECAFVSFDENGITKCAVEEAHNKGEIDFKKPISCHLYPIRVSQLRKYEALNYDKWSICSDACKLGQELNITVFRFLKEPIIRKWGENFFKELIQIDEEIQKSKK